LVRHLTGDIIRFTSLQPPRLIHIGQIGLHLNECSENTSERDVIEALVHVCREHRWTITQFHVAPLAVDARLGGKRVSHEWWIELQPGARETPTGPVISRMLDHYLRQSNPA